MFTRIKVRNMKPKIIKNIGNIAKAFTPEEFGEIRFISFRGISETTKTRYFGCGH